jgi:predicted nucleotidyltransferase
MRITEHEKNVIVDAVKSADPNAKVWLFGSRVDDSKKGGDIDILRENINVLNLSADWVRHSYEQTNKIEVKTKYA